MRLGVPPSPIFASRSAYVESLGELPVWQPYVAAILTRHEIAAPSIEVGFVGKYPTFLIGDIVVKLFGCFPTWRGDHAVEFAMQRILREQPAIPAPRLIAHGSLYADDAASWPYLIVERLTGIAWRDANLSGAGCIRIARRIGEVARTLHTLPVPADEALAGDWLADHRGECVPRLRVAGTLPTHLIDQVHAYLAPRGGDKCLTHGDLTEDHLFISGNSLDGIIDWGDAQSTDPYYDLGPLYLGAFAGDKRLLGAFLTGYEWPDDVDFVRRAMSATLIHRKAEFLVRRMGAVVDLPAFATLDDLADAVWRI